MKVDNIYDIKIDKSLNISLSTIRIFFDDKKKMGDNKIVLKIGLKYYVLYTIIKYIYRTSFVKDNSKIWDLKSKSSKNIKDY